MSGPLAAILLTVVVHFIGMAVLIALMGREILDVFGTGSSGGGGAPPEPDPEPRAPAPTGEGLPLADADPAAARLREPGRIAEQYPRRPRRPEHAPEPRRVPERS